MERILVQHIQVQELRHGEDTGGNLRKRVCEKKPKTKIVKNIIEVLFKDGCELFCYFENITDITTLQKDLIFMLDNRSFEASLQ